MVGGEEHSVAVGCSSWQGVGWGGGRETQECLIFAGRWERCYLGGGFQQRPKHLGSWQPSQRGVGVRVEEVKGEVNTGSDGLWWGAHAAGESSKVQTCLMGSPPPSDLSSENWSGHSDSCLICWRSLWRVRDDISSWYFCLSYTGRDNTGSHLCGCTAVWVTCYS